MCRHTYIYRVWFHCLLILNSHSHRFHNDKISITQDTTCEFYCFDNLDQMQHCSSQWQNLFHPGLHNRHNSERCVHFCSTTLKWNISAGSQNERLYDPANARSRCQLFGSRRWTYENENSLCIGRAKIFHFMEFCGMLNIPTQKYVCDAKDRVIFITKMKNFSIDHSSSPVNIWQIVICNIFLSKSL